VDLGIAGMAMVPMSDPRAAEILRRSPVARDLLNSFQTEYGRGLKPTLLLGRSDILAKTKKMSSPIVAYRNIVALSQVLPVRASGRSDWPSWTDHFDFHAAQLALDEKSVLVETPLLTHFHVPLAKLALVPDPGSPRKSPTNPDDRLVFLLSSIWRRRYVSNLSLRKSDRLFRSLETAYQAAGSRFRNYGSLHEAGLGAVLWVSAFEMLAHPGGKGKADRNAVFALLSKLPHTGSTMTRRRRFRRAKDRKKKRVVTWHTLNTAQSLYADLYHARNKFAHGDRVSEELLRAFSHSKGPPLLEFASTLYRAALLDYIKRNWPNVWARQKPFAGLWVDGQYKRHLTRALPSKYRKARP
jgi:hypothetical protein